MQQKVNEVVIMIGSTEKSYKDVTILKGSEGIYIETNDKIGTDNEGNDLYQPKLTMYPWERVVSQSWTENTLIESVKQAVILEALQDLEDFLEDYEEDEDESTPTESSDTRDNPDVNPYDKKE